MHPSRPGGSPPDPPGSTASTRPHGAVPGGPEGGLYAQTGRSLDAPSAGGGTPRTPHVGRRGRPDHMGRPRGVRRGEVLSGTQQRVRVCTHSVRGWAETPTPPGLCTAEAKGAAVQRGHCPRGQAPDSFEDQRAWRGTRASDPPAGGVGRIVACGPGGWCGGGRQGPSWGPRAPRSLRRGVSVRSPPTAP